MQKITPNLWFDEQSEEAGRYYVSVFSKRPGPSERAESGILNISYYGEAGPRPAGMVLTVDFQLEGQRFTPSTAVPSSASRRPFRSS